MSQSSKSQRAKETQQSNDDWIFALIWCIKAVGCILWLAILFPALSIPAVVSLGMTLCYGIVAGMLTAVTFVAGYGTWAALDARSFEAWIAQPVRQRFVMWWRYTRNWESVCALNGLTTRDRERDRTLTPRLRSICIGTHTDTIDLRVVTGQSVNDWQERGHELAAAWRADRLTIRAAGPGAVRITITRDDLLAQPIPLPRRAASTKVNLAAVGVGITDTHRWWRVPVLGHHVLVAGATGAGKGSVLWSLIAGIAPSVRNGCVRLCVIDPKGGMELGAGASLFTRFLTTPPTPPSNCSASWFRSCTGGLIGCAGTPACTPRPRLSRCSW